jgi:uncharacterized protein with NAD-binding domain and iron-sulfur cluster
MTHIDIVGGGILGLGIGYQLTKAGQRVRIWDGPDRVS